MTYHRFLADLLAERSANTNGAPVRIEGDWPAGIIDEIKAMSSSTQPNDESDARIWTGFTDDGRSWQIEVPFGMEPKP